MLSSADKEMACKSEQETFNSTTSSEDSDDGEPAFDSSEM
jgi:hypothetical protein